MATDDVRRTAGEVYPQATVHRGVSSKVGGDDVMSGRDQPGDQRRSHAPDPDHPDRHRRLP